MADQREIQARIDSEWEPACPCLTCGEGTMWSKTERRQFVEATELRCDREECASFKQVRK